MEHRFGHDFSRVRVHSDQQAGHSARQLGALAYTTGPHIVFGPAKFAPATSEGRRLLTHELTHVVQQRSQPAGSVIQRCPDPATATVYDTKATAIKAHKVYKKLGWTSMKLVDAIVKEAKPKPECIMYIDKLKLLLDTPQASSKEVTDEFQSGTAAAVANEKKRLADPHQKAQEKREETATSSGTFTKKKGKFGNGSYEVDARDPLNILVKAKVMLKKKGTGTQKDIDSIKQMEDAIEKAASTDGYLVDIDFVSKADKDTFKVDVDPSQWETATNWSGGEAKGFAHELHHLMAFELDRYDYVQAHSDNTAMKVPDRLYWFREELKKPAGYNNPTSLMNSADNPNDDDACTVAGLPMATCLADRQKMRDAYLHNVVASGGYEEGIKKSIKKLAADPTLLMGVLKMVFRTLSSQNEKYRQTFAKKVKDGTSDLGKAFGSLTDPQRKELLAFIEP